MPQTMSIRITGNTVVAKKAAIETHFRGGLAAYEAAAPATVRKDDELIAVAFEDGAAAESWLKRLTLNGVADVALVDPASPIPRGWLDVREGEAMPRAPVRRLH